jgi:ABC-type multidrug transport system fused ATPase/permease subunit
MNLLKARRLQYLRQLWQTLSRRRRRQLLALQVLSLVAAAGEVANLGALLPFLRLLANPAGGLQVLGPMASPLRRLPEQHLLVGLGLGFMVVVVLSTSLRVFTTWLQVRLAALLSADLSVKVFTEVLRRPFSWHIQQNSSTVLGYLTHDVEQVAASIRGLLQLAVNIAVVLLLGGSLVALAPAVMLITAALLAAFYALVFRFTRATMRADGQRARTNFQSSLQLAQEALGGIRDVVLDDSQSFVLEGYRSKVLSYRLSQAANSTKSQVPRYLIEGFAVLLIVGISLSLALMGQGIEQQIPILGVLALGAYRLLQPMQQCFVVVAGLQAQGPSLDRLMPFLAATIPSEYSHLSTGPTLETVSADRTHQVVLNDVSFRYTADGPWVLQHLDLAVAFGERIAFVGTTGSGKSTCSDLILGLLRPTIGKVLVHGEDLHASYAMVRQWQQSVAHVPQSIYLTDASFTANIAFGEPEAEIDHDRVRRAAQQAQIAEMIESQPQSYSTFVGERGVRLSGGQRQRIGIARALYKRPKILVLDEATSALDNRTEAEVMTAIEGLDRNITIILIAHRLNTVQRCDRIALLEQGKISAVGSFEELCQSSSHFQAMANAQNP